MVRFVRVLAKWVNSCWFPVISLVCILFAAGIEFLLLLRLEFVWLLFLLSALFLVSRLVLCFSSTEGIGYDRGLAFCSDDLSDWVFWCLVSGFSVSHCSFDVRLRLPNRSVRILFQDMTQFVHKFCSPNEPGFWLFSGMEASGHISIAQWLPGQHLRQDLVLILGVRQKTNLLLVGLIED